MGNACSIAECAGAVIARGWCRRHYLRWYRYGDPTSTHNRWGLDINAVTKVCTVCKETLLIEEFYKRTDTGRPISRCKICYKKAAQDRVRGLAKYGLTPETYQNLLEAQGGVCAICKTRAKSDNQSSVRLSVDHDHKTGVVRGLLCYHCNAGMGMLGDDAARLRAAADYLDERA